MLTGADGYFSIDSLPRGQYRLALSHGALAVTPEISVCDIVESDVYVGTFLGETSNVKDRKPEYAAKRYLQLEEGNEWDYVETGHYEDSGREYVKEYNTTCLGDVFDEDAGRTYLTVDYSHNNRNDRFRIDGSTVYWYEPDILLTLAYAVGKPAIREAQEALYDEPETWNTEMPLFRFDKAAGFAWDACTATSVRDSSCAYLCISAEYAGLETIETTAGKFEDCTRFEFIFQTGYLSMMNKDSNADGENFHRSGSMTLIETRWFAPDVGLVKKTAMRFNDGDRHQEDGSFIFVPGRFLLESSMELIGSAHISTEN